MWVFFPVEDKYTRVKIGYVNFGQMIRIQRIELSVVLTVLLISLMSYTKQYCCDARAIMVEPPHRSSLWRFNYNTSVNLRDDGLNCGGYDWQWGVHKGRCGVCGDLWNGTQHNADGIYNSGIIVRRYTDGHYINITFEVSSNYLGYVEFRLCPRNSSHQQLTQSCFDRYPLWIDESHGTRYYIGSRGGIYDIHIRLPGGLVCKNCVLQWKYKTGYRYNGDETCKCLGCGKQEQYINCADIEITPTEGWPMDSKGPGRYGRGTEQNLGIPVFLPNNMTLYTQPELVIFQRQSLLRRLLAPWHFHLGISRSRSQHHL